MQLNAKKRYFSLKIAYLLKVVYGRGCKSIETSANIDSRQNIIMTDVVCSGYKAKSFVGLLSKINSEREFPTKKQVSIR